MPNPDGTRTEEEKQQVEDQLEKIKLRKNQEIPVETKRLEIKIDSEKSSLSEAIKGEQSAKEEAEFHKKKIELYQKFNDVRFLEAEDKAQLAEMVTDIVNEAALIKKQAQQKRESERDYQGAPLNDQQLHGGKQETTFEDTPSMIRYLRENPTPTNKEILRKLFQKAMMGIKSGADIDFSQVNPKQELSENKNARVLEVPIDAPPDANQESELAKFGIGKKRRRSEQQ